MNKRLEHEHVVVLGCGRSGTSILGELFDDVSSYRYYCEPPFVDLRCFDYSAPVAVKVPKESPGFTPSPGLSFPLDELLSVIPQPMQVFWIVRHPLDAICSLRVGIAQNWAHHPKPPDWQDWLTRPLLQRCAHHWNHINAVGFEQVANVARVVHFEDMIREPRRFAVNVCRRVGIDPIEYRDSLEYWTGRVQDTNNASFIEAECSRNHSRPDHQVRIGRWRENLQARDAADAAAIVRETATKFGYVLDECCE